VKHAFIGEVAGDERGSATLEFIILAIPLFIPMALYLSSVNANTRELQQLHNAARQSARAFVTSPTEELASVRAEEVISVFRDQIGSGGQSSTSESKSSTSKNKSSTSGSTREASIEISIRCESTPCLTPNSKVTVIVKNQKSGLSARDTQIVDSWRDSA